MDEQAGSNVVSVGVDLSEFYMSVEWDILEVPAVRYIILYIYLYTGHGKCSANFINGNGIHLWC